MAQEQFTLVYDGPALEGARMSVRDLAPSLLALSEALQAAQLAARPDAEPAALDIQAFGKGSFTIDFLLTDIPSIIDRAVDLFSGRESSAVMNLGGMLGWVIGAISLIKKLRTRKIRSEAVLTNGSVRITFSDGTTLEVPPEVLTISRDAAFRAAAEQFVQPLRRDGVVEVRINRAGRTEVAIAKDDVDAFVVPPSPDEALLDTEREVALQPLSVAFQENNKWRVTDGTTSFYAVVADLAFTSRVMANAERFGKGDILRVNLRSQQFRTREGLRTDHTIMRVLEHIRGPQQVPLPLEFDDGPSTQ